MDRMDWNPELWKQTWPHYSLPANPLSRAAMAESFVEKITTGVTWTVKREHLPAETWPVGTLDEAKTTQRLLGLWGERQAYLLTSSDGSLTAYGDGLGECWIR